MVEAPIKRGLLHSYQRLIVNENHRVMVEAPIKRGLLPLPPLPRTLALLRSWWKPRLRGDCYLSRQHFTGAERPVMVEAPIKRG